MTDSFVVDGRLIVLPNRERQVSGQVTKGCIRPGADLELAPSADATTIRKRGKKPPKSNQGTKARRTLNRTSRPGEQPRLRRVDHGDDDEKNILRALPGGTDKQEHHQNGEHNGNDKPGDHQEGSDECETRQGKHKTDSPDAQSHPQQFSRHSKGHVLPIAIQVDKPCVGLHDRTRR